MVSTQGFLISAPGKVILFGEHAVVYNKKCIATSLDKRTFVFAKISNNIILNCPDINLYYNNKDDVLKAHKSDLNNSALLAFLKIVELTGVDGCEISVRSE